MTSMTYSWHFMLTSGLVQIYGWSYFIFYVTWKDIMWDRYKHFYRQTIKRKVAFKCLCSWQSIIVDLSSFSLLIYQYWHFSLCVKVPWPRSIWCQGTESSSAPGPYKYGDNKFNFHFIVTSKIFLVILNTLGHLIRKLLNPSIQWFH